MTTYYAAHHEGNFDTVEHALARTGMSPEQIDFAKKNAQVNGSTVVYFPADEHTAALAIPQENGFGLWRGFTSEMFRGSRDDALGVIAEFQAKGVGGDWGILEWVPPASKSTN